VHTVPQQTVACGLGAHSDRLWPYAATQRQPMMQLCCISNSPGTCMASAVASMTVLTALSAVPPVPGCIAMLLKSKAMKSRCNTITATYEMQSLV